MARHTLRSKRQVQCVCVCAVARECVPYVTIIATVIGVCVIRSTPPLYVDVCVTRLCHCPLPLQFPHQPREWTAVRDTASAACCSVPPSSCRRKKFSLVFPLSSFRSHASSSVYKENGGRIYRWVYVYTGRIRCLVSLQS